MPAAAHQAGTHVDIRPISEFSSGTVLATDGQTIVAGAVYEENLCGAAYIFSSPSATTSSVTLQSPPPGRDLLFNGALLKAGSTPLQLPAGNYTLSVPASQTAPGSRFAFRKWSDTSDIFSAIPGLNFVPLTPCRLRRKRMY